MSSITEQVLAAQKAEQGMEDVVSAVAELVYRYPVGKPGFSEEDGGEFLVRFYPRIRRLVKRYRPAGTTFDSYLNASLRWQLRSLAAERTNARVRLATACDRGASREILGHDGLVAEPCPSPSPNEAPIGALQRPHTAPPESRRPRSRVTSSGGAGASGSAKMPAHRPSVLRLRPGGPAADRLSPGQAQRLLCMSLKVGDRLDPDLRARLATIAGCGDGWLEDRWQELRSITEALRARRDAIRVRRDQAWFRARCVEAGIANATGPERERLVADRARWVARFERARGELLKMADGPTHQQIAQALGIAKGTVDSSIFKARHELRDGAYRERLARLFNAT